MAFSDIVNVSITASTQAPTAPGFGVPLILGYHTVFTELVRYYTSLAAMLSDGFTTASPEYLAADALEAQNPAPPRWAVGRRTNAPTQIVELTPSPRNATVYTVTVNGTAHSYTSDSNATVKEIIDGLVSAIGSPAGVTPTNHSDTSLRLTGTSGTWFSWAVADGSGNANGMGLWTVEDITSDSEAEEDIAACAAADGAWYAFIVTHQNKADGALLASWAEANGKLFAIDLADSDIKASGSSDLASTVKTAAQQRTFVSYHKKMNEFMSAAWLGNCLPFDPGSETWKFKTLGSISADILTDSEVTYIKNKNGNWYQNIGGINITQNGTTGKPQYIDVVRFIDWLTAYLQVDVFIIIANSKKVPYTDKGIALIEGAVRGRLAIGVKVGGLADSPAPTVTVPRVSDEPTVNRANRTIPDIHFTATLAGAIHSLAINGTVSV